jgi:hypothetical protein
MTTTQIATQIEAGSSRYDLEEIIDLLQRRAPGIVAWDVVDDRDDSQWHTLEGWPRCECIGCGCTAPAVRTDDSGIPTCDECRVYTVTDDGDVVCSRMDLGHTCHVCGKKIEWGGIITGRPGSSNIRVGSCDCGPEAWVEEERGDWGHYRYSPGVDA